MANWYCDALNGSDANSGASEVQAKQTFAAGLALLSTTGGDRLYVQGDASDPAQDYVLTATPSVPNNTGANGPNVIEGYKTTPGTRDGRPKIRTATNSVGIVTHAGYDACKGYNLKHLHMVCTAAVKGNAITFASDRWRVDDCLLDGWNIAVYVGGSYFDPVVKRSRFVNCVVGIQVLNGLTRVLYCAFDLCTYGIKDGSSSAAVEVFRSVFRGGTNAIRLVPPTAGHEAHLDIQHCRIYGCSGSGVYLGPATSAIVELHRANNVVTGCGGYAFEIGQPSKTPDFWSSEGHHNAYYDNDLGNSSTYAPTDLSPIILTGDPYMDSANGDLRLNNVAGAGAACRALGYPGTYPGASWSDYADIGGGQHEDVGGGLRRRLWAGGFGG